MPISAAKLAMLLSNCCGPTRIKVCSVQKEDVIAFSGSCLVISLPRLPIVRLGQSTELCEASSPVVRHSKKTSCPKPCSAVMVGPKNTVSSSG